MEPCQNKATIKWEYNHPKVNSYSIKVIINGKKYSISKLEDQNGNLVYKGKNHETIDLNLKTLVFLKRIGKELKSKHLNPKVDNCSDKYFEKKVFKNQLKHKSWELKNNHFLDFFNLIKKESKIHPDYATQEHEVSQILTCLEITKKEIENNGTVFLSSETDSGKETLKQLTQHLETNCYIINKETRKYVYNCNNPLIKTIDFIFCSKSKAKEKLDALNIVIQSFKQIGEIRELNSKANGEITLSSIDRELYRNCKQYDYYKFPTFDLNPLKHVNNTIWSVFNKEYNLILAKNDPNSLLYHVPADLLSYIITLGQLKKN